jgi:hypothetical protein
LELGIGRSLIWLAFLTKRVISMLSRSKCAQLAAVAALTVLFGANASPTPASAQAGIQLAQADQKNMQKSGKADMRLSTTARAQAQVDQKNTKKSRKGDAWHSSSRNVSSDRSRHNVSSDRKRDSVSSDRKRHTVSSRTSSRTVVRRDHDRRRVTVRSRSSTSVAFVVLGPRVVYRAYGAGWCRGLHRGRHYDRRNGWHAGRHYGPFRC